MNGNGPDDGEVTGMPRRKRKVPSNDGAKKVYITCKKRARDKDGKLRYREKRVNVEVCRQRSQGITDNKYLGGYIEEDCLGCTMWLDQLRGRRKRKRKEV